MQNDFRPFLLPAKVVSETDELITLQVPKNGDYKFKLSKNASKNRFHIIAFVKSMEGLPELWKPWEHRKEGA